MASASPAAGAGGASAGGGGGARAAITSVAYGFQPLAPLGDDRPGRDRLAGERSGSPDPDGDDPPHLARYGDLRARARDVTGEEESVLVGTARIGRRDVVLISFDFRYLGGSVGQRAGDLICQALAHARRVRRPLVSLLATGGSRIQEGMRSLRQLPRIAAECARNRAEGVAHIAVAAHPTTGGVWAALGAAADVIVGVRHATVAFAGKRVRGDREDRDEFRAEGKYRTGQVATCWSIRPTCAASSATWWTCSPRPSSGGSIAPRCRCPARSAGSIRRPTAGWPYRPPATPTGHAPWRTSTTTSTRGCRSAVTGPVGWTREYSPASVAATVVRSPTPRRPAIAGLFAAVATATVPITSLVIGEGGSGGALALASPDRLWVSPDAYFSVIAPEAAAAILKRDPGQAVSLARRLRVAPRHLLADGAVQGIAGPNEIAL